MLNATRAREININECYLAQGQRNMFSESVGARESNIGECYIVVGHREALSENAV